MLDQIGSSKYDYYTYTLNYPNENGNTIGREAAMLLQRFHLVSSIRTERKPGRSKGHPNICHLDKQSVRYRPSFQQEYLRQMQCLTANTP